MPVDEWQAELDRREALEASMAENMRLRRRITELEGALERLDGMVDAPGWDWRSAKRKIRDIAREALASTPQPSESERFKNEQARADRWQRDFFKMRDERDTLELAIREVLPLCEAQSPTAYRALLQALAQPSEGEGDAV